MPQGAIDVDAGAASSSISAPRKPADRSQLLAMFLVTGNHARDRIRDRSDRQFRRDHHRATNHHRESSPLVGYSASMLLASVVETSRRVADTTKRLEKIDLLARLIRQLSPEEIEIVVFFLSGQTRQGRIGVGYAALRDARNSPAATPSLEILDVDGILQSITGTSGSGSQRRRLELLQSLFSRATEAEQQFLTGLLMGELRQGALEGIMAEAVAKASGLAPERVRRAAMLAGDIARVARAALEQGEAGLAQYDVQLFRPIQPMLAQSADDVPEALAGIGEAALEYKMDGARVQVHKSGRRRGCILAQLEGRHPRGPGSCRGHARASRSGSDPGRRSDQPAARRPAAALSDHHAAFRPQTGRQPHAPGAAHDAFLVRPALSQRRRSSR